MLRYMSQARRVRRIGNVPWSKSFNHEFYSASNHKPHSIVMDLFYGSRTIHGLGLHKDALDDRTFNDYDVA